MVKSVFLVLCSLWAAVPVYSQQGAFPPVRFPPGKNVCDDRPWQLVFQDHFNGNTLNPDWLTYNSWAGMPGGDHENWGEARCVYPYNSIYKDANIEVGNGTVKLNVKKEPVTWQCAACPSARNANYSSATIALPYTRSFNAGKLEARIKMPTFKWAHSTFWTYMGGTVNEIDVAEAYGVSGIPSWQVFGYAPTCNYSLHAWEPGKTPETNPYDLKHEEVTNRYPDQTWHHWISGNYFSQDQFHTYTCEWDTAVVRFYLDGQLVNELWKYYQGRTHTSGLKSLRKTYSYKVGSGCTLGGGDWKITPGFPHNNQSSSNLRFTVAIDKEDGQHADGLLGAMEIDYVKMWQRQPENGWKRLADTTAFMTTEPGTTDTAGYTKTRASLRGKADPVTVICAETHHRTTNTVYYNLHANAYAAARLNSGDKTPVTYEWTIDYGPNFSLRHRAIGQSVATPEMPDIAGATNKIKWKLRMTSGFGTVIKTGRMNDFQGKQAPNNHAIYVTAEIPDDDVYERAIQQRLNGMFIDERADAATIDQIIERIKLDELAPYILPLHLPLKNNSTAPVNLTSVNK